jgi:hypothetical protein
MVGFLAKKLSNYCINRFFFYVVGRDSKIYVFRLSEFEPETQKEVKSKSDLKDHKLERTRGCSMYAISKPGGSRLKMVNIIKTIIFIHMYD